MASVALAPAPSTLALRAAFAVDGVVFDSVATAAYIGVQLGPDPRDRLTTGPVRRSRARHGWCGTGSGWPVVAIGWPLDDTLGPATVVYAPAIGPLVQPFLPTFSVLRAGGAPTR